MPIRLTCPHCLAPLQLPKTGRQAVVLCPRCLRRLPNPELPENTTAIQTSPASPLLAIDDEARNDQRTVNRSLLIILGIVLKTVFFAYLIAVIIGPKARLIDNEVLTGGMLVIGGLYVWLVIPRFWVQVRRLRILRATDPIGFDRAIGVVLQWIIMVMFALAAAFLILVKTCK